MKFKRAAALAAAILFILLALGSLIMAVAGAPANYLMAALVCLVLIPVFFYAGSLMGRVLHREDPDQDSDSQL